tara:strand:+ start:391 stop:639 length:249 start_codon:yes stop_codon:yes gene_type:complete
MPSGHYENDMGLCGICGRKLRPLYKNKDWESRKYHVSCFREMVSDISNYNAIAISKYGHTKKIANMPIQEAKKQKTFVIKFE